MHWLKTLYAAPGDAVSDRLGTTDLHERGLIRQLVNSLIWITAGTVALLLVVL
jgi:hypothetical protein